MLTEYLKHLVIRTPLEAPAQRIRRFAARRSATNQALFEEAETQDRVLERLIKRDWNCIDIGCHLGSMLSQVMTLAPDGKHMAFEPLAYKAKWLRDKFPEVDVRELALSDQSGNATFFLNADHSGYSGLANVDRNGDRVQRLEVRMAKLDDELAADHQVAFIKLDVEGAELGVLRGARRTLLTHRPTVLFECTLMGPVRHGGTAGEIHRLLVEECGYGVYMLGDWFNGRAPLDLAAFEASMKYPAKARNFLAVAREPHC